MLKGQVLFLDCEIKHMGNRSFPPNTAESPQAVENTRVRRFDTWKRSECPSLGEILVGAAVTVVLPGPIGDSGHNEAYPYVAPLRAEHGIVRFVATLGKTRFPGSPEPPKKWEKS